MLMTELVVDAADFEMYSVRPGVQELTFSLKELRAILNFCDVSGQPVSVYFSDPGQPILWTVNCFDALVVDFVLATLVSTGDSASQQQGQQQSSSSQPFSGMTPFQAGSTPTQPPYNDSSEHQPLQRLASDYSSDQDSDDFVPGTPERGHKKLRPNNDDDEDEHNNFAY